MNTTTNTGAAEEQTVDGLVFCDGEAGTCEYPAEVRRDADRKFCLAHAAQYDGKTPDGNWCDHCGKQCASADLRQRGVDGEFLCTGCFAKPVAS